MKRKKKKLWNFGVQHLFRPRDAPRQDPPDRRGSELGGRAQRSQESAVWAVHVVLEEHDGKGVRRASDEVCHQDAHGRVDPAHPCWHGHWPLPRGAGSRSTASTCTSKARQQAQSASTSALASVRRSSCTRTSSKSTPRAASWRCALPSRATRLRRSMCSTASRRTVRSSTNKWPSRVPTSTSAAPRGSYPRTSMRQWKRSWCATARAVKLMPRPSLLLGSLKGATPLRRSRSRCFVSHALFPVLWLFILGFRNGTLTRC